MRFLTSFLISVFLLSSTSAFGQETAGNTRFESFNEVKKILTSRVYPDHRRTIYCDIAFDKNKTTRLPAGFEKSLYAARAKRIEFEHVVPAENFGRTFPEWREGSPLCIKADGKPFKGRKCAEEASAEYRLMQADMYNLYPAVGSVNAMRSNFNFTQFPKTVPCTFGSCCMKISDRRAEPPDAAKGVVARTYFYMESAYPRYRLSDSQRKLFEIWDSKFPVTAWECERARRVKAIQGNSNTILEAACYKAGL